MHDLSRETHARSLSKNPFAISLKESIPDLSYISGGPWSDCTSEAAVSALEEVCYVLGKDKTYEVRRGVGRERG